MERSVALAQRFAAQAARLPFATIANQVVLNQVLVRFEPPGEYDRDILHAALASEIQREGTCWIGAGRWRGHAVLRVSVSNWSTDETAIDDAVTSLARAVEKVFAKVPTRDLNQRMDR